MSVKKTSRETNPDVLRKAMTKRLPRRTTASGQIEWPAIPALLPHYMECLSALFTAAGRTFSATELAHLREIMKRKLEEGFTASPFSKVTVSYETQPSPSELLDYAVSCRIVSIADQYADWVKTRTPPLFGKHADAKVMELARSLGGGADVRVLDVGAGTGRNTLPLARAGYGADAVELSPALAKILRDDVAAAGFPAKVFEGDALDPALGVPAAHYQLVVLAEVVASHFRNTSQIRSLFERAAEWLAPGGLLLFSAFLSSSGYKPDAVARELSEAQWCCLFTRRDLDEAATGMPFTRIGDESAFEFEHEHLDASAWPPTGWFADWSQGLDLFAIQADKSPMELRWLTYRREG